MLKKALFVLALVIQFASTAAPAMATLDLPTCLPCDGSQSSPVIRHR